MEDILWVGSRARGTVSDINIFTVHPHKVVVKNIYSRMAEIVQKQQQAHGVYENTNGMPMANGKNLHMEVSACCPFLAL
jgi:hypothetical protein